MSIISEFKQFALRGNVIDLAVAVVIGAAFGKIVAGLVDGVIMPLIGLLLGGINVSGLSFTIGQTVVKAGVFLQSIIDFTLIAVAIFAFIKVINMFQKNQEKEPEKPTNQELLLMEIRDLLKSKPPLASDSNNTRL